MTFRNYCDLLEINATALIYTIPLAAKPFGLASPEALTQLRVTNKTWDASLAKTFKHPTAKNDEPPCKAAVLNALEKMGVIPDDE